MTLKNGPPAVLGPRGGSVINVINVVKSMHAMISHIMSECTNSDIVKEMSRHIKIFLTYFAKMDKCMEVANKEKKDTWISSYNFVCLLNIPQQVLDFGSVHQYWEGVGMGENFIQVYTPVDEYYVAVEPMTGISNSFNNSIGLHTLEPNQSISKQWKLKLSQLN